MLIINIGAVYLFTQWRCECQQSQPIGTRETGPKRPPAREMTRNGPQWAGVGDRVRVDVSAGIWYHATKESFENEHNVSTVLEL